MPVVLAGRPVGRRARSRGWRRATTRGSRRRSRTSSALGHERIAFFGGRPDYEHVQVREARWRAALAGGAGCAAGPVVHADDDAAARRRWRCCASEPTAVVCASDVLAMAVVAAARSRRARRARRRLRGRASTTRRWPRSRSPPLTSVRVDYAEFGEAAARALLAEIGGRAGAGVLAVGAGARRARVDGAGAVGCRRHGDRDPHRLRHLRAARASTAPGREPVYTDVGRGARLARRRGRASTCCTSRATAPGIRGSPTTSRTARTSRR